MLVTVTNASATIAINSPVTGEDGVALPGGNHPSEATHRSNPLPYPFDLIGELAASGTKQLPMQPQDWRYSRSQMRGVPVEVQWSQMVQAGVVTLAVAAQANVRDSEEIYIAAV
jgi:hypothetical protein